ncbi:MAG: hypothetical protein KF708_21105 [Pirellulales bacterium]|nr:hypothetical protein [Pirellulales bacterium]
MRDELLGYLLGSLEPDEVERLEEELRRNPQLQRELEVLSEALAPLSEEEDHHEPPPGLALRTCEQIQIHARVTVESRVETVSTRMGWSVQDFMVAAGIMIAASMLFFPAVSHSRFQAQLAMCQNNLRMIGAGVTNYSQAHGSYFPAVAARNGRAVPAAFASLLSRTGFVEGSQPFVCPSSATAEQRCMRLPTPEEIDEYGLDHLRSVCRSIAGNYCATAGYTDKSGYHSPRNFHRETFAIVSDAPCQMRGEHQSSNHGGDGQNVLFEDGHVVYLHNCNCQRGTSGDDIFRNDDGKIAAGSHRDDSVITFRIVELDSKNAAAE